MNLFLNSIIIYSPSLYAKPTQMHIRSWNKLLITGQFNEQPKLHYLTDIETRLFSQNTRIFDQQILRQGFGYSVNDQITLWIGGDYHFRGSAHPIRQESRIWPQILYKSKLNNQCNKACDIDFTSRSRLEQRFASHEPRPAVRLRQLFQFEIPILNQCCPKQFKTVLFNEVFFNLNKVPWVPHYLIDQNRAFIGINRSFCDNTSITFGYMNQYIFRRVNNEMYHIVYLVFNFK